MRRTISAIAIAALLIGIGVFIWLTYASDPDAEEGSPPADSVDEPGSETRDDTTSDAEPTPDLSGDGLFAFHTPIDFDALAEQRARALGGGQAEADPSDPLVRRVLAAGELLGLAENLLRDAEAQDYVQQIFNPAASTIVVRDGPAGYGRVGELAYRRFLDALAMAARDEAPDYANRGVPRSAAPQLAAGLAGQAWRETRLIGAYVVGFAELAEREGLLEDDGTIAPGHEPIVHLLFRYLWAQRGNQVVDLARVMSSQELVALRRWQLERSKMPLDRRLEIIERSRGLLGNLMDLDRTEAIIRYHDGDLEGARRVLTDALASEDNPEQEAQLQAMLDAIDRAASSATD